MEVEMGLTLWQLILFALGIAVLLCEAATPGVGFTGILGIAFILIAFIPGLAMGQIPVYSLLFVIGASALMIFDSRIPGLGPFAVVGLLLFFGALASAAADVMQIIVGLALTAVFSLPSLAIVIWRLPRSKAMKRMTLEESLAGNALPKETRDLAGLRGVTATDMRPSGSIYLEGKKLHATTYDGQFLKKGTEVTIVRMQNGMAVVKDVGAS